MIRDWVLALEAILIPAPIVPVVNFLSGPFALFLFGLLVTYFQHHHRFHQLGIAMIAAGFACQFFRQIGVIDEHTTLWVLTPLGIMVLTVMAVAKLLKHRQA